MKRTKQLDKLLINHTVSLALSGIFSRVGNVSKYTIKQIIKELKKIEKNQFTPEFPDWMKSDAYSESNREIILKETARLAQESLLRKEK